MSRRSVHLKFTKFTTIFIFDITWAFAWVFQIIIFYEMLHLFEMEILLKDNQTALVHRTFSRVIVRSYHPEFKRCYHFKKWQYNPISGYPSAIEQVASAFILSVYPIKLCKQRPMHRISKQIHCMPPSLTLYRKWPFPDENLGIWVEFQCTEPINFWCDEFQPHECDYKTSGFDNEWCQKYEIWVDIFMKHNGHMNDQRNELRNPIEGVHQYGEILLRRYPDQLSLRG